MELQIALYYVWIGGVVASALFCLLMMAAVPDMIEGICEETEAPAWKVLSALVLFSIGWPLAIPVCIFRAVANHNNDEEE